MKFDEYKSSISDKKPPQDVGKVLQALWYDAKGDWKAAHQLIQSVSNTTGAWIHAYLHRKEGDLNNASYWYSIARKIMPDISFEEEWEKIVRNVINGTGDK